MDTVFPKALLLILLLPGAYLFGQEEPMEMQSIWEVSESDGEIWITFIDEKQHWWWLLYRGHSSDRTEFRNTISIAPMPLGKNALVPMVPIDSEEEKKVLSMIRRYLAKMKPSESNESRVLNRLLKLKDKQPTQSDVLTDESSPQP